MTTDPTPDLTTLAAGAVDTLDLDALRVLRGIYAAGDPVPPTLVDRVKFAITLDDLEAEVALLQRDAVPELVARSASDQVEDAQRAKSVTFTSESLTTMVTISPVDDATVRLDGWAAPGAGVEVELRVGAWSHRVTADEDGRFVFEGVEHGMAQLVVRPADPASGQHPVVTPAIEI